jgi:predicted nucleotide-binding protein (sugar kinase/HSP70/actin superfamily)
MGAKPYLVLEIDAHTADAGLQTRLEAFLDIIRGGRVERADRREPFRPARIVRHGRVTTSSGETVALSDPRVRIHFPTFSPYHAQAVAMVARSLGLHTGEPIRLDRAQLERGLQFTSGRECLPLPICIGQMLEAHERRSAGDVTAFLMLRGGAPCAMDCYMGYLERFINEQRLPDLVLLTPDVENDFLGLDQATVMRGLTPAILVADLMVEVEQVLRVVGVRGSVERLQAEWERLLGSVASLEAFQSALPGFVQLLAAMPRTRDPAACPRIVVTGDFFTRFSPFFMEGVAELYAERGIILKPVDLSDHLLYIAYNGVAKIADEWGMKPGGLALAKALTRAFQSDGKGYLTGWLGFQMGRWYEDRYRRLFRRSGLLVAGANDASSLFERAREHVSPALGGEVIPTVGKGVEAANEGFDGIIVIGPFNCLPYRISEAILKPLSIQHGMPILTYESDGYAVSPAVVRQIEVHIQQVLDHCA